MVSDVFRDIRHGLRLMIRQPTFSAITIVVLALGIGAVTAVYGMVDGLLLRPLPVERPSELVKFSQRGDDTVGYALYERLEREAASLAGVLAYRYEPSPMPVDTEHGREQLRMAWASDGYFDMLGVAPEAGRTFGPGEADWASEPVAVVSHAYARQHGDRVEAVLGRRINYLNRTFTVIGVMPVSFVGVEHPAPHVWVPLRQTSPPDDLIWTRARFLKVVGRLAPGVSVETAAAEAAVIRGEAARVTATSASNGYSSLRERFATSVLILQALVVLVLLVACANLANLMLARGASRHRELAIRMSVGASRGRLVRQLATESLVLGLAGGSVAILVAWWLSLSIVELVPPALSGAAAPLVFDFNVSALVFVGAVSVVATFLFGTAPALRVLSKPRSLHGRAAPAHRRTTSRGLVVGAVALSTALVAVSGLFARTLLNLWTGDSGFVSAGVVVGQVQMPPSGEPRPTLQQYEAVLAHVRGVPEVAAAGFSRLGQLTGTFVEFPISLPGEALTREQRAQRPLAIEHRVSPGFLRAMGTAVTSGRDVADNDTETAAPVALVNEAFAREYFGGGTALGRRFQTSSYEIEVVGVVKDTRWVDLREDDRPMFYRPARQAAPIGATFAVRSTRPLDLVGAELRRAGDAAGVRFSEIVPFADMVERTLVVERLLAYLSGGVGIFALLIVAVGMFGLLNCTVTARTRELGVRRALGAGSLRIQSTVLRESLLLTMGGVVIGGVAVALATPVFSGVLFGLAPTDLTTLSVAVAVLCAVTVLAASIPAYRASRVDPVVALRAD
jgi:predicted permease